MKVTFTTVEAMAMFVAELVRQGIGFNGRMVDASTYEVVLTGGF